MTPRRTVLAAGLAAALPGAPRAAAWPERPVRLVVGYPAGGPTDYPARLLQDPLQRLWGQPIVIENRPGAGGTIAANAVAKSDPDGHTVLVHSSSHAVNPAIYPTLPFDTLKDLTGVTPLAAMANVMVVSPSRGWKSLSHVPRRSAEPKPWLLCMLRLCAAISV